MKTLLFSSLNNNPQSCFGILLSSPIYKPVSYLKYKDKLLKYLMARIFCSFKCLEPDCTKYFRKKKRHKKPPCSLEHWDSTSSFLWRRRYCPLTFLEESLIFLGFLWIWQATILYFVFLSLWWTTFLILFQRVLFPKLSWCIPRESFCLISLWFMQLISF